MLMAEVHWIRLRNEEGSPILSKTAIGSQVIKCLVLIVY